MNCIERSKLKLRPHQLKVLKYFFDERYPLNGLLIVHPPGTGKTLTAVTASQCFLDKNPDSEIIFVGPASLITNFRKEMICRDRNSKRDED